jgi:NAD(P)-dependent dehydrogenase (short-subunit alcohol dehydrogenase family)
MPLLRANLLEDKRVATAGGLEEDVTRVLTNLGAELEPLRVEELAPEEERVGEWARARVPLHGLIYAASGAFGGGGDAALSATLDEAWAAVREVAVGALIEADQPGRVVLVAPRGDAGALAGAVTAGLENLARTLSVEWARYGVTAVAVAPGPSASAAELATLIAFVLSEAGGYLSGCRLELGAGA